jgi:hypothetical protein
MNAHFRQNLTSEPRDFDFSSLGVLPAAVELTVVAGDNLTVGSTWLPAETVAPGR